MESKQTAVEWLIEQIENKNGKEFSSYYSEFLTQAKAMEKKQLHKCASFWRGKENDIEKPMFDLYYNETYGE
jgi:hypothetical protein